MSEEPVNAEEPKGSAGELQEYTKFLRPFSKLAVELKPEDLAQKGVQKLILAEVARLENEAASLSDYEMKFHEKDKECAISKVRLQKGTMLEILYTIAIAVGSALIGLVPSISNANSMYALIAMATGLLLFALLAKWKGGKNEG